MITRPRLADQCCSFAEEETKPTLLGLQQHQEYHFQQPNEQIIIESSQSPGQLLDELFFVLYDGKGADEGALRRTRSLPMRLRRLPKSFFIPPLQSLTGSAYSSEGGNPHIMRSMAPPEVAVDHHHPFPPGSINHSQPKTGNQPYNQQSFQQRTKAATYQPQQPEPATHQHHNSFEYIHNSVGKNFHTGNNNQNHSTPTNHRHMSSYHRHHHQYHSDHQIHHCTTRSPRTMFASIEVTATTLKYQKTLQLPQPTTVIGGSTSSETSSSRQLNTGQHYQHWPSDNQNASYQHEPNFWLGGSNYQSRQFDSLDKEPTDSSTSDQSTALEGVSRTAVVATGSDYILDLDAFESGTTSLENLYAVAALESSHSRAVDISPPLSASTYGTIVPTAERSASFVQAENQLQSNLARNSQANFPLSSSIDQKF